MTITHAMLQYITLNNVTEVAGELAWNGFNTSAISNNTDGIPIRDIDEDGNIDRGVDWWASSGGLFTGYTINVGGTDYAVFKLGTAYYIPFNAANGDLGTTMSTMGSTTTFVDEVAVPTCFFGGTKIATPGGEVSVEDLRNGDVILTHKGQKVAVKWIGRQTIKTPLNLAHDERRAPVCIAAGTLGNHSDLYVSANHGMIVDAYVINASALVNGSTIRFVPVQDLPKLFTYYHIETEAHDVILANGAPSETFIDAAGRAAFDNHAEYLDLYGAERIIPEMDRPRISSRRLVPDMIKTRLGIAAAAKGWDLRVPA